MSITSKNNIEAPDEPTAIITVLTESLLDSKSTVWQNSIINNVQSTGLASLHQIRHPLYCIISMPAQ